MPACPQPDDPLIADELERERVHLAASRAELRRMREDVLSMDAFGGNPVSTEHLKAELYRRGEALRDLPDTPLFFGRLDYIAGDHAGERLHLGRRHVHDAGGEAMVIDWRAPASRPFYRATAGRPLGVGLRRRYGFSGAELTGYEDEDLTAGAGEAASRILIDEIERPRIGPMRDIVATIQPDQDDIVRADAEVTVCVQGAPGTGKTAVGLHRVAYLLYTYPERMRRGGVLVIGPNAAFLNYIGRVLPTLGEIGIRHATMAETLAAVPVTGVDEPGVARLKGDARMAEVLHRAVWRQLRPAQESLVVPRGSRRWRVTAGELDELVRGLRSRGVRYGAGRAMLGHRIAHAVLTQMERHGSACDDRTHDSVRRSRPVRAAVDALWPAIDPSRLLFRLFSEPELLGNVAADLFDADELDALCWRKPPRGPKTAAWSTGDAVLIDELNDLLERIPGLAHVVVDEAQDLSPMQARAVGRRCETGSATVLGDLAQATAEWATGGWPTLLNHLGHPDTPIVELTVGYRVPQQILDFASRLLPAIAPDLAPATSLRRRDGALEVRHTRDLAVEVANTCQRALRDEGSIGLIAADEALPALAARLAEAGIIHGSLILDARAMAGERLTLVPASLAKGLEFDQLIVCEPAEIAAAEHRGLHRLYVVLTRAVSKLTVLHQAPLPDPLG